MLTPVYWVNRGLLPLRAVDLKEFSTWTLLYQEMAVQCKSLQVELCGDQLRLEEHHRRRPPSYYAAVVDRLWVRSSQRVKVTLQYGEDIFLLLSTELLPNGDCFATLQVGSSYLACYGVTAEALTILLQRLLGASSGMLQFSLTARRNLHIHSSLVFKEVLMQAQQDEVVQVEVRPCDGVDYRILQGALFPRQFPQLLHGAGSSFCFFPCGSFSVILFTVGLEEEAVAALSAGAWKEVYRALGVVGNLRAVVAPHPTKRKLHVLPLLEGGRMAWFVVGGSWSCKWLTAQENALRAHPLPLHYSWHVDSSEDNILVLSPLFAESSPLSVQLRLLSSPHVAAAVVKGSTTGEQLLAQAMKKTPQQEIQLLKHGTVIPLHRRLEEHLVEEGALSLCCRIASSKGDLQVKC